MDPIHLRYRPRGAMTEMPQAGGQNEHFPGLYFVLRPVLCHIQSSGFDEYHVVHIEASFEVLLSRLPDRMTGRHKLGQGGDGQLQA